MTTNNTNTNERDTTVNSDTIAAELATEAEAKAARVAKFDKVVEAFEAGEDDLWAAFRNNTPTPEPELPLASPHLEVRELIYELLADATSPDGTALRAYPMEEEKSRYHLDPKNRTAFYRDLDDIESIITRPIPDTDTPTDSEKAVYNAKGYRIAWPDAALRLHPVIRLLLSNRRTREYTWHAVNMISIIPGDLADRQMSNQELFDRHNEIYKIVFGQEYKVRGY